MNITFKEYCDELRGLKFTRNGKELFKFELYWNNFSLIDLINNQDIEISKRPKPIIEQ